MTRPRRPLTQPEHEELNLAPIMNMVVILIPLLLLSVAFVSVSIIEIQSPRLCACSASGVLGEDASPPLNLTVSMQERGFHVSAQGESLPALAGCPADGPTICLLDPGASSHEPFARARTLLERSRTERGFTELEEAVMLYDWRRLYNTLASLKQAHPAEHVIHVSASSSIPHTAVIRLMDVARIRLQRDHYEDRVAFWKAAPGRGEQGELFGTPMLSIAQ